LPIELKRELVTILAGEVKRQLKKRGLVEKDIVADFEAWRKNKRATGRGR